MGISNSVKGLKSEAYHSKAKAGLILSIIFLIASLANHIYGALNVFKDMEYAGTYVYDESKIVLNEAGTCNISDIESNTSLCTWEINEDNKLKISFLSDGESKVLELDYNKDNKTLSYENNTYKKALNE